MFHRVMNNRILIIYNCVFLGMYPRTFFHGIILCKLRERRSNSWSGWFARYLPQRSTCLGRVVGRGGRERRVEEGSASECVPIV